jgi:large subunit ribosomal protein L15
MQLHTIKSKNRTYSQRIARGGKRGTTSGRGQKGQKSRAGHKIRPALRDLIARLPKRRGFQNKPTSPVAVVVNLSTIERRLKRHGGERVVSPASLRAWGIVPKRHTGPIKLLATGNLIGTVTVRGLSVSAAAKTKIEKAGGTIEG